MSTFRNLIITVAALALITPAHAGWPENLAGWSPAFTPPVSHPQIDTDGGYFECSVVRQNPQPRRDNDPVYKIMVNVVAHATDSAYSGPGFDVRHTVRTGREYNRTDQYDGRQIWQSPGLMQWNWSGQRGYNTRMIGSLYFNQREGWMYREGINTNGRLVYTMLSDCHPGPSSE
jgi:hypothetical protein